MDGPEREQGSELVLIPVLATVAYYAMPSSWQQSLFVQFIPQILGYACLAVWVHRNTDVMDRLGLGPACLWPGLRWGCFTGVTLGLVNVAVILWLVPGLGFDITFLQQTPHANMPVSLMLPWLITGIAVAVELNFRGFLLGRLVTVFAGIGGAWPARLSPLLAIVISALLFAFDPFMVATFRHLHWIAVLDGVVWGMMWIRGRTLYGPITAHAVEVMVMYTILKAVLAP